MMFRSNMGFAESLVWEAAGAACCRVAEVEDGPDGLFQQTDRGGRKQLSCFHLRCPRTVTKHGAHIGKLLIGRQTKRAALQKSICSAATTGRGRKGQSVQQQITFPSMIFAENAYPASLAATLSDSWSWSWSWS